MNKSTNAHFHIISPKPLLTISLNHNFTIPGPSVIHIKWHIVPSIASKNIFLCCYSVLTPLHKAPYCESPVQSVNPLYMEHAHWEFNRLETPVSLGDYSGIYIMHDQMNGAFS